MVTTTPTHLELVAAAMNFAERLTTARKHAGLTQAALAERTGIHVTQIRRYEAGTSAPTLDVLRNIAIGLSVTIDSLVFDEHERGPQDDLALAFEATRHLTPQEQATVRELIEAMLLKHEARRWAS
jgi:transcriptional regulator with XRE-family HTH domain